MAGFERNSVIICIIASAVYLAFGITTAVVCAPWQYRRRLWMKKSTLSVLLLDGFITSTIIFMSLIMLAMSFINTHDLSGNVNFARLIIITSYITFAILGFLLAPHLIRKQIRVYHNPISRIYRTPAVLAVIAGLGVGCARLSLGTAYATPMMIVVSSFAALMLVLFGMLKLYEIITLSINWRKAA